jgi:hypothetical protein
MPNTKYIIRVGHVHVLYEDVPKEGHMKEAIIRVHIVNLEGFLWNDSAENVVPTCTCPANRNSNDCCAGIMKALTKLPEFSAWYSASNGWLKKKELLSRRLRADLDPVSVHFHVFITQTVVQVTKHQQFVDIANFAVQQKSDRQLAASPSAADAIGAAGAALPKERACVPESQLIAGFTAMVVDARGDEFMVSIAETVKQCTPL